MANASKAKGDKAEREAVAVLLGLAPDLVSVSRPQRKLGAGRAEDTGDLWIFHDCAVQVRAYAMPRIGLAIRSAALDAVAQAHNGDLPHALGLVLIPGARQAGVRWLACAAEWPWPVCREPVPFELVGRMLPWLRDDDGPYGYDARPRAERVAALRGSATDGGSRILVAPVEAWLAGFRQARKDAGSAPVAA